MFSATETRHNCSSLNSSIENHADCKCTAKRQTSHFKGNNSFKSGYSRSVLAEIRASGTGFCETSPFFSAVWIIGPSSKTVTSESTMKKTAITSKSGKKSNYQLTSVDK